MKNYKLGSIVYVKILGYRENTMHNTYLSRGDIVDEKSQEVK